MLSGDQAGFKIIREGLVGGHIRSNPKNRVPHIWQSYRQMWVHSSEARTRSGKNPVKPPPDLKSLLLTGYPQQTKPLPPQKNNRRKSAESPHPFLYNRNRDRKAKPRHSPGLTYFHQTIYFQDFANILVGFAGIFPFWHQNCA
jgi:hypothetical protein